VGRRLHDSDVAARLLGRHRQRLAHQEVIGQVAVEAVADAAGEGDWRGGEMDAPKTELAVAVANISETGIWNAT